MSFLVLNLTNCLILFPFANLHAQISLWISFNNGARSWQEEEGKITKVYIYKLGIFESKIHIRISL